MPDGFWGPILGAAIAIASSLITSIVPEIWKSRANDSIDKKRKEMLVEMLHDPLHQWRNLTTLMAVIGADEDTTKRLLLEINARGSQRSPHQWGLISRNPLLSDDGERVQG